MIRTLRLLRRFALLTSGATFAVIGVLAVFAPAAVARAYGLALVGVDGLAEFRAVFTGFWLSLAYAMVTAATRRRDVPLLGNVCGVMILCQSLARLASLGLDGRPSWPFVSALVMELGTACAILAPTVLEARVVAAAR